jgi:lipopolysaccharide assembly outer membrane protein LptD (OstA)
MKNAAHDRGLVLFAAVMLALVLAAPLAAQQPPVTAPQVPAPPAAAAPGDSDDVITFTASRMESVIAKGKEKTILIGEAVVTTGSLEIKADRIELAGEDYNDVVCIGKVVVFDEEKGFLLKAVSLSYKRDSEIGVAQDSVVLEDSKNDVLLKAGWVRFDQKKSLVDARIGVHILKEDLAVRSEFARYNRDTESIELNGLPVAVSEDGTISADSISGTAGADTLEFGGRVSGTITTKKKEGSAP